MMTQRRHGCPRIHRSRSSDGERSRWLRPNDLVPQGPFREGIVFRFPRLVVGKEAV
jgi:hypothetical protein